MDAKHYLCIDLKSFFASVECVDRGLDSMTTDLVVADPARGGGAICLAVSPSLKAKGVRNQFKIMVGGAPVTQAYCESVGADYYTCDAASCADVALKICQGEA